MNKIPRKKYVFTALFCAFFFIISIWTVFGPKSDYSVNEKRFYAKFPKITAESVVSGEFRDGLEKYISDHVLGRDLFVGVNSYFSLLMGRNTLGSIYNCSDGYLINAPKETDTKIFEKNIERFNSFTNTVKIPSTLLMVPSNGYIMYDKLPRLHGNYIDDSLYTTADELTPDMGMIDPRKVLINGKSYGQICYKTDHHITSLGNYTMYDLYCSVNGIACPDESRYEKRSYGGFYGTAWSGSGYWFSPADSIELWELGDDISVTISDAGEKEIKSDSLFFTDKLNSIDKYPVFLGGNHSLVKIENPNAAEGNLLVIKDSYAQCFAAFLSHNYKNIYLVDLRYYRDNMSEFVREKDIDEILYMYGTDTLLTDTNSAWLY